MPTPQLDNRQLGTDTARLNLLTNGGFEIWQRGNGPFTTSSTYFADRWWTALAGTDTISISRNTGVIDLRSNYSAACTFTLGTGAGGTGIVQTLKMAGDGYGLRTATVTFSVRVYGTVANAVRLGINPDGTGGGYTYGSYHTGSGAYETLTITRALPGDMTTVNLAVFFAASGSYYLDNAMLVVGSVAADYAPLHPADDLARCLRYYEVIGGVATGVPLIGGYNVGGQAAHTNLWFAAKKPVVPTVTINGTWALTNSSGIGVQSPGAGGVLAYAVVTATGYAYSTSSGASQFISVEANP